jgi:simple sugar transport system permease protein
VTYGTGSGFAGIAAGMFTGLAVCMLMALLAVFLQVEQIIAGLALNLLAVGFTGFAYRVLYPSGSLPTITTIPPLRLPGLADIPWLGPALFEQSFLTYIALIMVPVTSWFLFRTRAGLQLRCAGGIRRRSTHAASACAPASSWR